VQIGPPFGSSPRTAVGEYLGEEVTECRGVVLASRGIVEALETAGPPSAGSPVANARVVARSTIRICQDLVRFENLPEAALCRTVSWIDIRMTLAC
jgi:hypothetical protein